MDYNLESFSYHPVDVFGEGLLCHLVPWESAETGVAAPDCAVFHEELACYEILCSFCKGLNLYRCSGCHDAEHFCFLLILSVNVGEYPWFDDNVSQGEYPCQALFQKNFSEGKKQIRKQNKKTANIYI